MTSGDSGAAASKSPSDSASVSDGRPKVRNAPSATYYTDRLFVIYEPDDYREYARKLAPPYLVGGGLTETQKFDARVAIEGWATTVIYRSHLSMFEFRKRLYALFDIDGYLRNDLPFNPLASAAERKVMTLQLGIEAMVRRSEIAVRITESPYYARLIYDTFYFLDTVEHGGEGNVLITPDDLNKYLAELGSKDSKADAFLGKSTLFNYLRDYARLITKPQQLREETLTAVRGDDTESARVRRGLADCIDLTEKLVEITTDTKKLLELRFVSDRYGYRENRPTADPGEAIRALKFWLETMDAIFGDRQRAWDMAADAGITPRQPSWQSIAEIVEGAEPYLGEAAPTPAKGEERRDDRHRENLNWALRQLQTYAIVFPLGVALALAGSLAAPGDDVKSRRLTGLRAVALLYRSTIAESRDGERGVTELRKVDVYLGAGPWEDLARGVRNQLTESPTIVDFVASPLALEQMAQRLIAIIMGFTLPREPDGTEAGKEVSAPETFQPTPSGLAAFDAAVSAPRIAARSVAASFWKQWTLVGGLLRRKPPPADPKAGMSGSTVAPEDLPTGTEILYAAAYGGVPIIPADPALLSVGDLTRIWLLRAEAERLPGEEDFASFAYQALRSGPLRSDRGRSWGSRRPVLKLAPLSADSQSWYWRPEAGITAVCQIPADAWAGAPPNERVESLFKEIAREVDKKYFYRTSECDAIEVADSVPRTISLRKRIFYGAPERAPGTAKLFASAPASLAGLVDLIHTENPGLFGHADGGFWSRLLTALGIHFATQDNQDAE